MINKHSFLLILPTDFVTSTIRRYISGKSEKFFLDFVVKQLQEMVGIIFNSCKRLMDRSVGYSLPPPEFPKISKSYFHPRNIKGGTLPKDSFHWDIPRSGILIILYNYFGRRSRKSWVRILHKHNVMWSHVWH